MQTTYLAYKSDLVQIMYSLDGTIHRVLIFPNNQKEPNEVLFWQLPVSLRELIEQRIDDIL